MRIRSATLLPEGGAFLLSK